MNKNEIITQIDEINKLILDESNFTFDEVNGLVTYDYHILDLVLDNLHKIKDQIAKI